MQSIRLVCRIALLLCWLLIGGQPALLAAGRYTVVIDAGHGGKDPGAMRQGYKEKDITLSVALKLGQMIRNNHPEVRVLYTRERDVFVGLQARADFANKHKASLMISVHVNSASASARGTETFVLGLDKHQSNLAVAMRENKAMLLEDDYKTTYKGFDPTSTESYIMFDLMQEAYLDRSVEFANLVERQYRRQGKSSRGVRQAALWVLSQSAMPSVLTEIGFISNARDLAYLTSESGQIEIARALAKAFSQFYGQTPKIKDKQETKQEDRQDPPRELPAEPDSTHTNGTPEEPQPSTLSLEGKRIYRVQFMAVPDRISPKDKRFRKLGLPVWRTQEGKLYKYMVGKTTSLREARRVRKLIARHYKDCFIVEYQGERRIGLAH